MLLDRDPIRVRDFVGYGGFNKTPLCRALSTAAPRRLKTGKLNVAHYNWAACSPTRAKSWVPPICERRRRDGAGGPWISRWVVLQVFDRDPTWVFRIRPQPSFSFTEWVLSEEANAYAGGRDTGPEL